MAEQDDQGPGPLDVLRLVRGSSLSSTDRHVLIAYVLRCDSKTWETFVGPARIAEDTGVHAKTVKRARARLRTLGILKRTKKRGDGRATDHHALRWHKIPAREAEVSADDGDRVSPSEVETGTGCPSHEVEDGDSRSLNAGPVGTEDPHDGDRGSPRRGQSVPLSAHDLPRGSAQLEHTGDTPPGVLLLFPGCEPPSSTTKEAAGALVERAKTRSVDSVDDQVRAVCEAWWTLWEERAPHVPGYKRKRSGKAAGAPATEELTTDDREAIRKALVGKGKRSVDELALLARWAFRAPEFSAAVLRGEAKEAQEENEHLSPVSVYRKTKIPAKLARARRWASQGEPRAQSDRPTSERGRSYETLDDLFGGSPEVIDVTPDDLRD